MMKQNRHRRAQQKVVRSTDRVMREEGGSLAKYVLSMYYRHLCTRDT
jgi:hypothetical protein